MNFIFTLGVHPATLSPHHQQPRMQNECDALGHFLEMLFGIQLLFKISKRRVFLRVA